MAAGPPGRPGAATPAASGSAAGARRFGFGLSLTALTSVGLADQRQRGGYHFGLRPDGAQRELRVVWRQCEFPQSLRKRTNGRSSPVTDLDVRVFVAGSWAASGELQATELRVLTP